MENFDNFATSLGESIVNIIDNGFDIFGSKMDGNCEEKTHSAKLLSTVMVPKFKKAIKDIKKQPIAEIKVNLFFF